MAIPSGKIYKNPRAFTMVELMVAITIISVGLVLILRSLSLSVFGLTRSQNKYLAARLVREKLEEFQEDFIKDDFIPSQREKEEEVNLKGRAFKVTIKAEPLTLNTDDFPQIIPKTQSSPGSVLIEGELYKVRSAVQWQERGTLQELAVSTFLRIKK